MLACLILTAVSTPLRIFETYEVDSVLNSAKGLHEVYLLVLYKTPGNLNLTSAAFARLIEAIPIPIDPILGIVVDSTIPHNQLLYADKSGETARIRFPYRQVYSEYKESLSAGVSHEVRLRLRAILATVQELPPGVGKKLAEFRDEYEAKRVHENMTAAVDDLITLKNQERAGVIKQALAVQQQLDEMVPPPHRGPLPQFSEVDPTHGDYEAIVGEDEQVEDGGERKGLDEDAPENDDLVGDDEAPKSLINTVPESDDDEEDTNAKTEDDIAEDRKRAGPIGAALDTIREKFRRLLGGDTDQPRARKRAPEEKPAVPQQKKREIDPDENPNPAKPAPVEPPVPVRADTSDTSSSNLHPPRYVAEPVQPAPQLDNAAPHAFDDPAAVARRAALRERLMDGLSRAKDDRARE
jgi:hypothetical protein